MGSSRQLTEDEVADAIAGASGATEKPVGAPMVSAMPVPVPPKPVFAPVVAPVRQAVGITAQFTKVMRGRLQELRRLPVWDKAMREEHAALSEAEKAYVAARKKAGML